MRRLLATLLGIMLAGSLLAQIGFEYGLGLSSNYVWRGYDFGVSPLIAPDVTASFGESGVWLDVWGAFGNNYKEVDLTIGYDLELNDAVALEPGLVYYWNDLDFSASTFEPFVNVSYNALAIPVNMLAAFNVNDNSLYLEPATDYEMEIAGYPLYLTGAAGLEFNSGVKALTHLRVNASTEMTLGPVLVAPSFSTYLITNDYVDTNSFKGVLSISLSLVE